MLNRIFPRQCFLCQKVGDYLCKTCKKTMKPHPEICPYCHKFSANYRTCLDCRMDKNNQLEWIIIPFAYADSIKKMIFKLKYFHKTDIAHFLVKRMELVLMTNQYLSADTNTKLISYVPSHRRRHYFVKGYNQSKILAKYFSKLTKIPRISIAKKIRHTKSQAKLSRNQRQKNVEWVFEILWNKQRKKWVVSTGVERNGKTALCTSKSENYFHKNNKIPKTFLLIDDVTTTGSTLNELAKQIKKNYPQSKVRGIVVARNMR